MSAELTSMLEPFGIIAMWFLIGMWVWRNDEKQRPGDNCESR